MPVTSTFVDLDRRFKKLDPKGNPEDAALDSYSQALIANYSTKMGLTWDDLLQNHLVVVLGEPGSGKSREFEEKSKSLKKEGKFSFFIRLDRLINETVESVLDTEQSKELNVWRGSSEEGIFFLDSVDESKFLRLPDFYTALDRFRNGISSGPLNQARILLSSRISEWMPESDGRQLRTRFPTLAKKRKTTKNNFGRIEAETEEPDSILVVQLLRLDHSRVERFVSEINVPNASDFLDALDSNYAWEFAGRPIDVNDLANFWINNNRLGCLKEIIEFSIKSKLSETQERRQGDPLIPYQLLCPLSTTYPFEYLFAMVCPMIFAEAPTDTVKAKNNPKS